MGNAGDFSEQVRVCASRISESGVAALAALFDLTSQRLVRYATAITRNQHDAEDAVQAALVRVVGNAGFLCRAAHPWAYLMKVVRNEALVILRRKRRWSLVANLSDMLTRHLVDEVVQEESQRAVWKALRSLPTAQAEVVVLKIWEEMTFAQIAEILGASAHTVASRHRYAMEKLSRKLAPKDLEFSHE